MSSFEFWVLWQFSFLCESWLFEFLGIVTNCFLGFCDDLSFWVLLQFDYLSFITIWVFELCHSLIFFSFVTILFILVLSQFEVLRFSHFELNVLSQFNFLSYFKFFFIVLSQLNFLSYVYIQLIGCSKSLCAITEAHEALINFRFFLKICLESWHLWLEPKQCLCFLKMFFSSAISS